MIVGRVVVRRVVTRARTSAAAVQELCARQGQTARHSDDGFKSVKSRSVSDPYQGQPQRQKAEGERLPVAAETETES
jgi:hypothetical protein